MKKDLQALLDKEVDRKDFLKHVGFGLVALTGATALTRSLTSLGTKTQTNGYGVSAYGGNSLATRPSAKP